MKIINSNCEIRIGSAFLVLLVLACCSKNANSQFLKKLGKAVAEKTVEKGVNKVTDKALDKGVDKVFEEDKKKEQDKKGKATKQESNEDTAETPAASINTYSKFDFVPGEQIIYAEDFLQDNVGELPLNWNSNSSGVVLETEEPKGKWIKLNRGVYLSGSKLKTFGKDYTVEWDMILNVTPKPGYYLPPFSFGAFGTGSDDNADNKFLQDQRMNNAFEFRFDPNDKQNTAFTLRSFDHNKQTFTNNRQIVPSFGKTLRKVAHYALSVQGTRLRLWINEEKVVDVPRAVNITSPINQLFFSAEHSGGYNDDNFTYLVSNLKVAAGKPDTRSKLITEGKFVTSGILFDVNSDHIKPQSYAVLKEVGDALKDNADVKIRITGHTDADGSPASNMTLSKKRAESVKAFLNKSFAVDNERMQTDGLGMTKPVADNKTPAGKASNRRVEFVKL
ncbi:MAG TPA: OmpA family protein [Pedobacter sp.]|nr:OmpA family protein [Pedobacter sp.]